MTKKMKVFLKLSLKEKKTQTQLDNKYQIYMIRLNFKYFIQLFNKKSF